MTLPINPPLPLSGNKEERAALDEYWMSQAIAAANVAAENGEVPVGAVLVKDNQLIATGWNQPIQHHDPSLHAEMVAIRQAGKQLENYRLTGTTLYVTLEPCAMCAGLILHARVQRVVFGAWDRKAGAAGSVYDILTSPKRLHHLEVEGGLQEADCRKLLQTFFQARRQHAHSV